MSHRHHYRTFPFEVRSAKPDGSSFEGYCAVFNGIDEYGTIMARGCFDKHLAAFKSDGFIGGLNHNWDEPIGKIAKAETDDLGLHVGGDVIDTDEGLKVRKLLAAKVCRFLSFGFDVLARTYLEKRAQVEDHWKAAGYTPSTEDLDRAGNGALVFTEVKPYEASPVMVPGNTSARITTVRGNLPLDEHLALARAAVDEVCERLENIGRLRADRPRPVPPERLQALRQLSDRVSHALAACQPRVGENEVLKLRRELLEMEAAIL